MGLTNRERALLLIGAAVVIVAAFYFLWYFPQQEKLRQLDDELQARQKLLSHQYSLLKLAPQLEQKRQELDAKWRELANKVPYREAMAEQLVHMEDGADQCGILLAGVTIQDLDKEKTSAKKKAPDLDGYESVFITVKAMGSYQGIRSFIEYTENSSRLNKVVAVNLKETKEKSELLVKQPFPVCSAPLATPADSSKKSYAPRSDGKAASPEQDWMALALPGLLGFAYAMPTGLTPFPLLDAEGPSAADDLSPVEASVDQQSIVAAAVQEADPVIAKINNSDLCPPVLEAEIEIQLFIDRSTFNLDPGYNPIPLEREPEGRQEPFSLE